MIYGIKRRNLGRVKDSQRKAIDEGKQRRRKLRSIKRVMRMQKRVRARKIPV